MSFIRILMCTVICFTFRGVASSIPLDHDKTIPDLLSSAKLNLQTAESSIDKLTHLLLNNDTEIIKTEVPLPRAFVHIDSVSKSQVNENEHMLTVRYRPYIHDIDLVWTDEDSILPHVITELKRGLFETKVLIKTKNDSIINGYVMLLMGDKENSSIHVNFELQRNHDYKRHFNVTNVVVPGIKVKTSEDIVYNKGSDVIVDVEASPCEHQKWDLGTLLVDLNSGQVKDIGDWDFKESLVQYLNHSTDENNKRETIFKIKTSQFNVSGLLSFSVTCPNNESIFSVLVQVMKILRPVDQVGPYPTNTMYSKQYYGEQDDNGVKVISCMEYKSCRIVCDFIGENITDVDIVKTSPGPVRTSLPGDATYDRAVEMFNPKFSKAKTSVFSENIKFYKETKFECTATNSQGDTLSKTYKVYVPGRFIKEKSQISVIESKDDTNIKQIDITCTVRAQTQPSVTFTYFSHNITSQHSDLAPDLIQTLPNDEYVMTKHVTVDLRDRESLPRFVSCQMINEPMSYTDYTNYLYLDLPPTLSN